jgi:glycerate kinase
MRILLAPDKFKGTLTAAQAIEIMRRAIEQSDPAAEVSSVIIADGGDGTLAAAAERGYALRKGPAVDALRRPSVGSFGRRGDTALVELASICGLATVLDQPLRPFDASSLGLGMMAKQAVSEGAREVLVALGGSASVDGGLGFLMGLGFAVTDGSGRPVSPNLSGLGQAVHFDRESVSVSVHECRWRFLTDVDNPLLGPDGAAAIFGPQKGLSPTDITVAERSLEGWTHLLGSPGRGLDFVAGMGAAGGVAFAGAAALSATLESGAAWVANLAGLDQAIANADIVVTGEGAFDLQSFGGKAPNEVIRRAVALGKEVYVVAGTIDVPEAELRRRGVSGGVALATLAGGAEAAREHPATWLAAAVQGVLKDRRGIGVR